MGADKDSKHLGITGNVFHTFHGIIQVIEAVPLAHPQSSTGFPSMLHLNYKQQE